MLPGSYNPPNISEPGPFAFAFNDVFRPSTSWSGGGLDFTGCALAAEDEFRWVIVAAALQVNSPVTGILINGLTANLEVNYLNTGGSPDTQTAFGRLLVPAGPTCSVRLQTAAGVSGGGGICVFTATGGDQAVHQTYGGSGTISLTGPAQPNALIAIHQRNGTGGVTLSGLTQVANSDAIGSNTAMGYKISATGGTFSQSVNTSGAGGGIVLK